MHTTIQNPLFSDDGGRHFEFINASNCENGYPNGICLSLQWLNLNEWGVWLFFLAISLLIPLFFVIYTKEIKYFPLFFIFTGFFWNTMLMQVFSQIYLSIFFVFFIFHKNQKHRLIILNSLLFLLIIGVKFHNQEFIILLGILFIELLILLKDSAISFIDNHPEWNVAICGIVPANSVMHLSTTASSIRDPMAKGAFNLFQSIIYYSFSFFIENMFIGFVIPAIYYVWRVKWYRLLLYTIFVIVGALIGWAYLGFGIWYVTRVVIWLPLVLFVPFIKWLNLQTNRTKVLFYLMGFGYFCFNVSFFILKMQRLACGI